MTRNALFYTTAHILVDLFELGSEFQLRVMEKTGLHMSAYKRAYKQSSTDGMPDSLPEELIQELALESISHARFVTHESSTLFRQFLEGMCTLRQLHERLENLMDNYIDESSDEFESVVARPCREYTEPNVSHIAVA